MSLIRAGTWRRAVDIEYVLHILVVKQKLLHTFRHGARTFNCGALRECQFHREIPLVLRRHEALRQEMVEQSDGNQRQPESRIHDARARKNPPDHTAIKTVAPRKPKVDKTEKFRFAACTVLRAQQFRTHHRRQRERHDGGDNYRHGNGYGELAVKLSGYAGKETHRHEHRA